MMNMLQNHKKNLHGHWNGT